MFLATTAVEEFWDTNQQKILLAGEWCRLYKKEYFVETECLPFIWNHVEKVFYHYYDFLKNDCVVSLHF